MNVTDAVTTDYVAFSPDTTVSKLVGAFDDPSVEGVVVESDEFEGVVTRRQLATSHHPPDEKLAGLVWHVPKISPDEDVRKVAQLMIDADSHLLPVFEGQTLTGVVTAEGILREVLPFLDEATVREAASRDLVTVEPQATFGEALHVLRENRITHLPVVDDDSAVGILSLYDVVDLTVRAEGGGQGGNASGTDSHGGSMAASAGRSRRGGFGSREGETDRVLDLPVRDLMVSPVRTIHPDAGLDEAVRAMFEVEASSLVVTENGSPYGIVTTTDVLDALTWEAEGNRAVQVYGTDLLDDLSYDEVVAMIDGLDDKDGGTNVLDARIHLHEHTEKLRGTPLLLARVRLHTDGGLYIASGEGYGAAAAVGDARDTLTRRIRDDKTHGKTKKHPDEEYWEKRFGWWLEA
jgi:CBS domain-containing protein